MGNPLFNLLGNATPFMPGPRSYSRHDDRDDILERLDYLMENSGTEQERQAIRQALNTLENM